VDNPTILNIMSNITCLQNFRYNVDAFKALNYIQFDPPRLIAHLLRVAAVSLTVLSLTGDPMVRKSDYANYCRRSQFVGSLRAFAVLKSITLDLMMLSQHEDIPIKNQDSLAKPYWAIEGLDSGDEWSFIRMHRLVDVLPFSAKTVELRQTMTSLEALSVFQGLSEHQSLRRLHLSRITIYGEKPLPEIAKAAMRDSGIMLQVVEAQDEDSMWHLS